MKIKQAKFILVKVLGTTLTKLCKYFTVQSDNSIEQILMIFWMLKKSSLLYLYYIFIFILIYDHTYLRKK